MQQYSYKNSGIEWLSAIPEHWGVTKVKKEFRVIPSNVDKKSHDDEEEVKLCNYVDVYYNDFISSEIDFMVATASEHETKKFQLQIGDILITKDSEDPFDIAVPALVKETEDKLLCGYHLSMIRTINRKIDGAFLFWSLKDDAIVSQLFREATGVTRWAIASRHIKDSTIAFPPLPEQEAIADYLDKACARIDRIIAIKEEQLRKIAGNLRSNISQLFSFGLDRSSETKTLDDHKYLGRVPKHWKVTQVKFVFDFLDNLRVPLSSADRGEMVDKIYDYYGASGIIDKVENYIFDEPLILIGEDGANLLTRSKPLAFIAKGKYWVNNHAHVLKPKFGKIKFWTHLLGHLDYSLYVTGAAQPKLSNTNLGKMKIAFPVNQEEQDQILSTIELLEEKTVNLKKNVINQIDTLQSYRKSLIHECVTGKKQVYTGELKIKKEVHV